MTSIDEKVVSTPAHIDDASRTQIHTPDGQFTSLSSYKDAEANGDGDGDGVIQWTVRSRLSTIFLACLYVGESRPAQSRL